MQAFLIEALPSLGKPTKNSNNDNSKRTLAAIEEHNPSSISLSSPAPMPQTETRNSISTPDLKALEQFAQKTGKKLQALSPEEAHVAVFKAGAKYLAITEFLEACGKVIQEWHHTVALRNQLPTPNSTYSNTTQSPQENTPFYTFSKYNPLFWTQKGQALLQNLYQNIDIVAYLMTYFAVAFATTWLTKKISRNGRIETFVNHGMPLLNLDPIKQMFELSVGTPMTQWVLSETALPFIREQAPMIGINTNHTETLVNADIQAGIKGQFAYEAIFGEIAKKGPITKALTFTYLALDYLVPTINGVTTREIVARMCFYMIIGYASLKYLGFDLGQQRLHPHVQ
jgi:hypothetical protein